MVEFSLEAAKILKSEHDIDCEVINLRSLKPLDRPAIIKSVTKTNRIVNDEEGWPQHGVGSEIAALFMESETFDHLERDFWNDVLMPYFKLIEDMAYP